jgi:hypothetical protein
VSPPSSPPGIGSATSPPPTHRDPLLRPGYNSVGKVIDTLLRNDLLICDEVGFTPLDDAGAQLLFGLAAAYERRALGIASHRW